MAFRTRGRIVAAALLTAVLSTGALPAQAAAPFDLVFPAGQACSFELGLNIAPSGHTIYREFKGADGRVRTIDAGKGHALTFTNVSTGASVSTRSDLYATTTTRHADGSSTVVSIGHNLIILFPTDIPAGPSTKIYIGAVTYTSTAEGVFTITGSWGKTRDICAELD
ncbi:hypothetical protein [Microbacterium deminutum]|uniref:DUF4232 domain-containing protein n=1 Tax=Microbacterium deminutum TaxID=344164 RepID=A0ABN2QDF3_9MICO